MLSRPAPTPIALALLLVSGCHSADSQVFPSADVRARQAARAHVVITSSPDAEFSSINGVDADSRGRIYVSDWMQRGVTVLSSDGHLIRRVGRDGSGPGEFRAIRGLEVLPGDSVLAYDPELARLSIFDPDSMQVATTVNLAGQLHGASPFRVYRVSTGAYVGLFRSGFAFGMGGGYAVRRDSITVLGGRGTPRASIAHVPARPFLIVGTSVAPNPFGREPLVATDSRGRIQYVWTDSLAVHTYNAAGQWVSTFAVPYQSVEVTQADVQREIAAMDDYGRRTFSQVLSDSMPRTWPAVRDLLVDDADRLWIGLGGPRGSDREWAVFTPEGRYLRSVLVPEKIDIRAVRRSKLYGQQLNSDGVPSVVVLTLDRRL